MLLHIIIVKLYPYSTKFSSSYTLTNWGFQNFFNKNVKKVSKKFCHVKNYSFLCKVINNEKQEIMKATVKNTTAAKQQKLIEFAKSLGITIKKLEEMYKDPVKASVLNVIAEGL